MLLVTEAWSDPIKDTNKLTPLLRRHDLTCSFERTHFIKMGSHRIVVRTLELKSQVPINLLLDENY